MKTSLNVLLLTGWITISLFVVCGFATAECNIAVVANRVPGNNIYVDLIALEFEINPNIHLVRAGDLQEMKAKVVAKRLELGSECTCIDRLYIVDHGHPGIAGIGNGQIGTDNIKRITPNNKINWEEPLAHLGAFLCRPSNVFLFGCHVGYCQNAQTLTYEVAKLMTTTVWAPVNTVFGARIDEYGTDLGFLGYLQKGEKAWLIATQYRKPDHKDRSVDDKARNKTITAGIESYCPCNGGSYAGLQDCINGCQTSLSCFTGICDPIWVNNTCDKFSGNPILTGGTMTATSSALLATSRDQKRVSGNLGSIHERPAGKSASKSTRAALAGWDDYGLSQPAIHKDGALYRMWFAGYDSSDIPRIGLATSTDGINWGKYNDNPVLQQGAAGSWDETQVYNPTVIKDGTTFKMWFTGYSRTTKHARIGYATSTNNGQTWTKHPTYVLDVGASGAWDEDGVGECCVIKDGDTYKMWFGGSDYYQWWRTGYATSTDGINWAKYSGNPVLSEGVSGNWDEWAASAPAVIKDGSVYHMLYGGTDAYNGARIGYATSLDGKNWTKSTRNPLIIEGLGSAWDNGDVFHATFFKDSNEELFKVFYRGYSADTNAYALGFAATTNFSGQGPSTDVLYVNVSGNCGGKAPCYTSIQAAINAAGTGAAIRIAQGTYPDSITLSTSISLTLQGGWNSTFTSQASNTTFIKAPKAPQGSLTLQMLTAKP
jgi:predicted GH43/DUF377 family glycosyl hydrolase